MTNHPHNAKRVCRARRWSAITYFGGGAVTAAAVIAMAAAPAANADDSTASGTVAADLMTLAGETDGDLQKADVDLTQAESDLSGMSHMTLPKEEVAQALLIQQFSIENDTLATATEESVLAHGNAFDVSMVNALGPVLADNAYQAAQESLAADQALVSGLAGDSSMATAASAFAESAAVSAYPAASTFLGDLGAMAGGALGDLVWDYGTDLLLSLFA